MEEVGCPPADMRWWAEGKCYEGQGETHTRRDRSQRGEGAGSGVTERKPGKEVCAHITNATKRVCISRRTLEAL